MRPVLQELLAALDVVDVDDVAGAEQVLDRARLLVKVRNCIDAELSRTVRKAENMQAAEHDGLTSMRSWLRGHLRLSAREAHRTVMNGRVLERLPAVAAGFVAGSITAEQVAVVAPVAAVDVQAEAVGQGVNLAAIDATLADVAATQIHARLGAVVAHFLSWLDPDGSEPDPTEQRAVAIARHGDGSVSARLELDPVGGEKFCAVLESMVQASRPAGDVRTRAQQLGDALVQWADNTLASGQLPVLRTVKPQVVVRVDLADLVDPAVGPGAARTWFGAQISAARARWMACDGGISRVVFGPDGHTLELGRTHRVVSAALRRAVELRDGQCVFAGCDAPSYWCDVHHVVHWVDGGRTDLENSALVCEQHHTKVHHGFRVERQPDGRWRTYRPDGSEIVLPESELLRV